MKIRFCFSQSRYILWKILIQISSVWCPLAAVCVFVCLNWCWILNTDLSQVAMSYTGKFSVLNQSVTGSKGEALTCSLLWQWKGLFWRWICQCAHENKTSQAEWICCQGVEGRAGVFSHFTAFLWGASIGREKRESRFTPPTEVTL